MNSVAGSSSSVQLEIRDVRTGAELYSCTLENRLIWRDPLYASGSSPRLHLLHNMCNLSSLPYLRTGTLAAVTLPNLLGPTKVGVQVRGGGQRGIGQANNAPKAACSLARSPLQGVLHLSFPKIKVISMGTAEPVAKSTTP